jgi:hypothetical protein
MAHIESQSEIASHEVRNFFKPSLAEILLYCLLGIILLVVLNAGNIIDRLGANYLGSPQDLKTNFTTLSTGFSDSFSSALGGRLGQIILWSFVGAISYIALWFAKNILNSFENDMIAAHYLHPSSYSRVGYWGSAFSAKIFFAALVLITAAYLFVVIAAVLPATAALAGSAAYNFHGVTSPFYILFSIVGIGLVLYIAIVLLRLVSHLWKHL